MLHHLLIWRHNYAISLRDGKFSLLIFCYINRHEKGFNNLHSLEGKNPPCDDLEGTEICTNFTTTAEYLFRWLLGLTA